MIKDTSHSCQIFGKNDLANQTNIQNIIKNDFQIIILSFHLSSQIMSQNKNIFLQITNQLSLISEKTNNSNSLLIQFLSQDNYLGIIEDEQDQITLQFQKTQNDQYIISYYSNETLKNTIRISNIKIKFKDLKEYYKVLKQRQQQSQDTQINYLLLLNNFKLSLVKLDEQQKDKCQLQSISEIDKNYKICVYSTNQKIITTVLEFPYIQQSQKRYLTTVKFIHGSNMISIAQRRYTNTQTQSRIESASTLNTFMVVGYFKLTVNMGSIYESIIQIGVQKDYYIFLNLYITSNTSVELRYIHDTNNQIKKQAQTLSSIKSVWITFGIVYQLSGQKAKLVYSDSTFQLNSSTAITSAQFSPSINYLDVCISCIIEGGIFTEFTGQFSTTKIIYGVDFDSTDDYFFFNEYGTIDKTSLMSSSFDMDTYTPNSEYDLSEGFICDSGYAFFEGVCIYLSNCQNLVSIPDIYESFEMGKYYDSSTKRCKNCGSNCLQCSSNTVCNTCRSSYILNSGKCVKCDTVNNCNTSCSGANIYDPINQMCVYDLYNPSSQVLYNPLLSTRVINNNYDVTINPSLSFNDSIVHCYIGIENVAINFYTYLGGASFTTSTVVSKAWSNVPKGYQKSVTFYALLYSSGTPSNLKVKINSNIATLDSSETVVLNKSACSGSGSVTQSIYKVKFIIQDYEDFFNLEIQSTQNKWGIRNLNIEIQKCHPTCKQCYLGGEETDCSSCGSGFTVNKFQCNCPTGQYAKYDYCFLSQCATCKSCSITNCLKCEDITGNCTQCNTGYKIKDGLCISDSQCTTNSDYKIYFNYCGVYIEDGFEQFKSNKIVQYSDYWQFYNDAVSIHTSETNKKCLPRLNLNNQHTLQITMPNYYSYHYQIQTNINILAYHNIESNDKIFLYDDTTLIFQKTYKTEKDAVPGSPLDAVISSTFEFAKATDSLFFKFESGTDADLQNESFSFCYVNFRYERCNPMCKTCSSYTLISCVSCIDNATKVGTDCQCNDGYYFSYERFPTGGAQPGSCLQCNQSCKTCNAPSYRDCILCSDGYTKINGICQYNCQDGQYWDQASLSCLDCHPCCRTCDGPQYTDCHDCKSGYSYRASDKSCLIYNAQCKTCTIAVGYLCGGTLVNHDSCVLNGWVNKEEKICVNCLNSVSSQCGGDQTQEVIDTCVLQGYFNYNTNTCSSCKAVVSGFCGRSEIKVRCLATFWEKYNATYCVKCTNVVNGSCGLNLIQDWKQICVDKGYYKYDSNNCSSCINNVSGNCGRSEIQSLCNSSGWFIKDASVCVNCNKVQNGQCGIYQSQQSIDFCKYKGFYGYDNDNCSSCKDANSFFCGRNEIKNNCYANGWVGIDQNNCANCSKYINGFCGGDQDQTVIDACILEEFFNYDANNCSPCRDAISNNCGRSEIQSRCLSSSWEIHDASTCVNCIKFINNKCSISQSQVLVDSCVKKGFYNYDSQNCSSCRNTISGNCGRSEIYERCYLQGWDKVDSNICKDCNINSSTFNECIYDNTCQTCSRYFNPLACNTCKQSLYFFRNQCLPKCPSGHIISGQDCIACTETEMPLCINCYSTCLICNPFQISADPATCTMCSTLTRYLTNGKCECLDIEDSRDIFFECSYQHIAVLQATLSNTDAILTIDFGKQLNIPNGFQQNEYSQSLCEYLFIDESLYLLGVNSECLIFDKQVVVILDQNSKVFHKDFIKFKIDILSFVSTPNILIKNYYNNMIVQNQIIGDSKITFDYPIVENSCNNIKIKFKKLSNSAKRGVKDFSWSIDTFDPPNPSLESVLQTLLQKANTEKSINIIVTQGIVKPDASVSIKINYTLLANVISSLVLPLTVKIEKKISIDFDSPIVFPFYRFQSGILVISSAVKICQVNGELITIEPLDFSITCDQFPQINYQNSNYLQPDYKIELNPYTFNVGDVVFKIKAKLVSNNFIESQEDYQLNISQSLLFIKIIGGNGYSNYKKQITLNSKIRDYDLPTEAEDQGISIQWKCIFPGDSSQCVSKDGKVVDFPQPQSSITIEGFTFNPYTVIKIEFTGNKNPNRRNIDVSIILLSEIDLPPLDVQIQSSDPNQETINLNEEIFVKLNYQTNVNVDLLSFSGTISYDNEVVGIIKFDYTSLRFQIWNYFSNFKRNLNTFQIRFNVFNPQYFMPSMSTNTLALNFPPENCKFTVTPSVGGFSLQTKYFLKLELCKDDNTPIQFQFFYYKHSEDFEYEKQNPLQVKRRQFNDKQKNYFIETILPPGKILLLAQAIDSKNAIFNTTILIDVQLNSIDEQQYISLVSQKIDQSNSVSPTDAISDLSILCDDILQRTVFKLSALLNQKKIEIINQLNSLSQKLSVLSQFSTVADKAQVSLSESGIVYSESEQKDLFSKLIEQLDNSSILPKTSLDISKEKLKQKLYDNFQLIDNLGNPSPNTEAVDKLSQITDKIGNNFFKNILPNEDPIFLKGQFINILGTQITEKYICQYFYCEDNIKAADKQPQIYNYKKLEYKENPFSQETSFLNYTNTLKKQNPEKEISQYQVIVPSISNYENEPVKSFPKQSILNFPNQKPNTETKKMACLSKDQSSEWTTSGCENVYNSKSNSYLCLCNSVSATTIIDDIEDLLDNENIKTAFSSEGISNIASFKEFYKYAVFWILLSQTMLFVSLYYSGNLLDAIDGKFKHKSSDFQKEEIQRSPQKQPSITNHKVVPITNQIQQELKDDRIQDKKLESESKYTTEVNLLQSPQFIFQQNNENNVKDSTELIFDLNAQKSPRLLQVQSSTPTSVQNLKNQSKVTYFDNQTHRKFVKKSKLNLIMNNVQVEEDSNLNAEIETKCEVKSIIQDKNTEHTNKPIEKPPQNSLVTRYQRFQQLSIFKQIIIFHSFFGIFFLFNQSVPRSIRFLIFYVRSIHSLCISVIFDQNYSIVQKSVISAFNALSIIIMVKIFEKLMSIQQKGIKVLSRFITTMLLGGYYYVILSIVSGQSPDVSNSFILTFGILYIGDLFVISFVVAIFMRTLAKIILRNQYTSGIQKYLYKLLELQLVLLSVDMD